MSKAAKDRLAKLLAGTHSTRSDSTMVKLPRDAIELGVAGIGDVMLPVRAQHAKRLISVARPAQFGRGEQTLSDTSVRDTWELTPDQVNVAITDLDATLEQIRDELGLPAGSTLRAELHSLLIYGKGQFFLPHQDSEKQDDMVATLVVILPSVHTGGELIVDDGGSERTYRGSREDLVLVGFYADRRHEVRPVRSGYRVTLTFNLLLTGPAPELEPGPIEQATRYIVEHVATPVTSQNRRTPTRLAFLLDHEYTEAGLASNRFKGADGERVATLLAAAERAGCESRFALAEIREMWDALPAQEAWDYYDDELDEDHESDEGDYELNELIEDETTLGWWIAADGSGAETIALPLSADEVCAVTPTKSLTPYESEYEGYMGNYGNTVERWYRRAAVVLWPKEKAFAARAEAGSEWALRTLQHRIDTGDLTSARADTLSLEPFWHRVDASLLSAALQVAEGLRGPASARVLLAPFQLEMLTAQHASLLARLAATYDDRWLRDLLAQWDTRHRFAGIERTSWINDVLLPLGQALRARDAAALADHLVGCVWGEFSERAHRWVRHDHPQQRRLYLTELGPPLARILEATSDKSGSIITDALTSEGDNVVELLVPTLRAHRPPVNAAMVGVANDCKRRLARVAERPVRAQDDWSIAWTGCGCTECGRLATFLTSPSAQTLEWPLAERGRQHVEFQIDKIGLPVRHTTRRQGRPYTLVLKKTEELHRREQAAQQQAEVELDWLTTVFGRPQPG